MDIICCYFVYWLRWNGHVSRKDKNDLVIANDVVLEAAALPRGSCASAALCLGFASVLSQVPRLSFIIFGSALARS